MKVAPVLVAALVLCIAIPGSHQGKGKKPKFCLGNDGNRYKKGKGYEDKEACIRYTCTKIKGNKFKMKEKKIQCTETTTTPTTTTSMTPAPSTTTTQGESEPGLASNVTALEASVLFLNGSVESIENKLEALQSNVESLQTSVESLQTSVESILGMMTTMQSTSSKLELNITSNTDAINKNEDACLAIETTAAKLETCLGDVNSTDCPSSEDGKISVVDAIKENKEDIEACEACEKPKFNLVVTGGYNGVVRLATSETIGSEGVCSQGIPPLPVALESHNSVFIDDNLMTCGGYDGKDTQDACYFLKNYKSQWIKGPSMKIPRRHYSLTKVGEEVFAVGGVGENHVRVDSMEKYTGGEWTLLPQTLSDGYRIQHCTVYLKSLHALVVIGGNPVGNKVQSFNISSGQWTDLAPLPVSFLAYHRCIVLDETIYVTGGETYPKVLKQVFKYKGEKWETSGELEEARKRHSIGLLDGKVMVVGGEGENGALTSVETMDHNENWKKETWSIADGRYAMARAEVPSESFPSPCL